jgi:hypothetical protein
MIPRIIHQYWDRPEPPESVARCIQTWREKNPRYRHFLWNDASAAKFVRKHFGLVAEAVFKSSALPTMRADLFRLMALLVHGGVYVDADEECRSDLDPLLKTKSKSIFYCIYRKTEGAGKVQILRNGFMCAEPGHWFIRRILVKALQGVGSQSSPTFYNLTGAPVITGIYRQMKPDEAEVKVISREEVFKYTNPRYDHAYRTEEGHWSEQVKNVDIYGGAPKQSVAFAHTRYVFAGHPRCGSAALSAGLKGAGINAGHERMEQDGIVSWWSTGRMGGRGNVKFFKIGKAQAQSLVFPDHVYHYIRHPASAIPSIAVENEHNGRENNSFRFRRMVILKQFGQDLAQMPEIEAAAASYVYWNKLAERASDSTTPILIEKPDFSFIQGAGQVAALPVRNTTEQKFGVTKAKMSLEDILSKTSTELQDEIKRFATYYEDA